MKSLKKEMERRRGLSAIPCGRGWTLVTLALAIFTLEARGSDRHGSSSSSADHTPSRSDTHAGGGTPGASVSGNRQTSWGRLWGNLETGKKKWQELTSADLLNEVYRIRLLELEKENARLKSQVDDLYEQSRVLKLQKEAVVKAGSSDAVLAEKLVPEVFGKKKNDVDASLLLAPPRKLFQQSLLAFERHEYERAARGFVALLNLPDNDHFRTAQVHFLAGISFYKLKNYKQALGYLGQAEAEARASRLSLKKDLVSATDRELMQPLFEPKAIAWKSLCLEKMGQLATARAEVHRLLAEFPQSLEVKTFYHDSLDSTWSGKHRAPASLERKKKGH